MKKVIVFDMDGVIFDSIEAIIDYQIMKFPSLTREEYLNALMGVELDSFRRTHTAVERTAEKIRLDQEAYKDTKSKSPIHPGMDILLEKLHTQGFTIILNTNAYDRFTLPLLENNNISRFFDFVMTRDTSESKSAKFKMIFEKYNVSASDIVFVTDTVSDLRDANTVYISTIGVTWGVHTREYFNRESFPNLLAIVDTVAELESLLVK